MRDGGGTSSGQGGTDPIPGPSVVADAPAGGAGLRPIVRSAPLAPVAAAMVAGVLAGRYLPAPIGLWAGAAAVAFVVAVGALLRPHLRSLGAAALAAAILFVSAAAAARACDHVPADHIVRYSGLSSIPATLRGRIASDPQVRGLPHTPWRTPQTRFLLDAAAIRRAAGGWIDVTGTVRVTVGEVAWQLAAGDEVELVGTLSRPRPPGNPGQYDARQADRRRRIHVGFFVPGADGVTTRRRAADAGSGRRLLGRLRATARHHFQHLGSDQEQALLEALVLGRRAPALEGLNRTMVEAGVAHFLSISGLHLGIFLGFVYWLCRLLTLPVRRAAVVVLVVLAAYLLLAEPRTPLLRGAVMAAALCLALISGRALSVVNALAAAAVVLLAADPLQLFQPGFQLSFCIVGGIVVLRRPIARLLFGRWRRRRGLMVFRDDQRVRRWLTYRAADWGIDLVSLSLAAYLAAAPLVAYHFGIFSPYAPLLSILLLPVTAMVLIPAYASAALSWLLPNASWTLGRVAAAAAGLMHDLVLLLRRLPGLSVDVYAVPAWLVALSYAALALWAAAGRYRRALTPAAVATAAVLAAAIATQLPASPPADGRWHVLDVGHGAMVLLHAPDGKTHLFDAGTLQSADACHQVLRPFLRAKRLPPPETLFISHANADHYNAAGALLEHAPPRRVYLSEFFGNAADDPPDVRELAAAFGARGVEVVRLRRGETVALAGNVTVEVLWPPPADEAPDLEVNDTSLVLRVVAGRRSLLLTGDIDERAQAALTAAGGIRSDVLLLPHHGGYGPTLKAFIDAVGPELLVQSSGYHHDRAELLEAIAGRRRLITSRDGWIQIDLAGPGLHTTTMHP